MLQCNKGGDFINIIDLLAYFFIYSFVGRVIEVAFHVITKGKFINRGFLNGPYCPIYGFGAVAVVTFLRDMDNENKFVLFFASMFIATAIELVAGFILEKVFHKRWWDYSDRRFNLGGYICAEFSFIWGALCYILYEVVHPLIREFVRDIPSQILIYIIIALSIVFIIDFIATVNTLLGLNKKFKTIDKLSTDIKKVSDDIGKRVADKTFEALDKKKAFDNSEIGQDFDDRSKEFKEKFSKFGERRILRAFPNLIKDLDADKKGDVEKL